MLLKIHTKQKETDMATNENLLRQYCLNIIKISTNILQDEDLMCVDRVDDLGKLVQQLADFRNNNYIDIPF